MGKLLTLVKAICFKGQKGDKGDPGVSVSVGQTTTGAPGTSAAVENVGTASDPILNFTIPKGDSGVSVANIAKTSTSGNVDTYTITMTDGTTYTFTVRNGEHKQAYISQAAYNALVAAGTVDPECYYYIIDDTTLDGLEARASNLETRAGDLEARASNLETRAGDLETDVAGLHFGGDPELMFGWTKNPSSIGTGLYLVYVVDTSLPELPDYSLSAPSVLFFVSNNRRDDHSASFRMVDGGHNTECRLRAIFETDHKVLGVHRQTDGSIITDLDIYVHKICDTV